MGTFNEIMNIKTDLRKRGFDYTFSLEHEHIRCIEFNELVMPHDFEITEIHYCKTPEDMRHYSIIYGIELERYGIKGILMSHYESYLTGMSLQLWAKFGAILQKMNTQSISRPHFNHLLIVRTNN
jgi:hypothetical protein